MVKKGLPSCLYHCRFLNKLPEPVKERLKIPKTGLPNFEQWAIAVQANSDSEMDEEGNNGIDGSAPKGVVAKIYLDEVLLVDEGVAERGKRLGNL